VKVSEYLEITIPVAAKWKAVHAFPDDTLITVQLDANMEERLIHALQRRFRERVAG
jgi:hypothetical protein